MPACAGMTTYHVESMQITRDEISDRLAAVGYVADRDIATALWLMDYFLPTAVETPHWETDWTTTPSPHHPIGAKGVGESPNVGGVPCFSNAINDAFAFLGSTHIQMPHDHSRTWTAAEKLGLHG